MKKILVEITNCIHQCPHFNSYKKCCMHSGADESQPQYKYHDVRWEEGHEGFPEWCPIAQWDTKKFFAEWLSKNPDIYVSMKNDLFGMFSETTDEEEQYLESKNIQWLKDELKNNAERQERLKKEIIQECNAKWAQEENDRKVQELIEEEKQRILAQPSVEAAKILIKQHEDSDENKTGKDLYKC